VARKYNLHYARLIASCKQANIPFPASGYWTRRNMGRNVSSEVIPLAGSGNDIIDLITNNSVKRRLKEQKIEKVRDNKKIEEKTEEIQTDIELQNMKINIIMPMTDVLDFLDNDEKNAVLGNAYSLVIDDSARLHKVIVQYKKRISVYAEQLKKAQSQTYYNPRYHKPDNEPEFFKELSEEGMKRIIAILDVLFKVVEKLGGTVNDDLSMKIRSDIVRIRVAEGQNKVQHELTKQEAQALVNYNDEVKHHHYASKPQIRQYDHVHNEKLRIVFGEKSYIRDSETEKLEDRLGDVLIALYEKSEENRIIRERREEEQRKRDEEARRQEELRKRKETEIRKTKELANKAEDYRIATEIRAYIQAMIENQNEEATPEWIEWANSKADWYDPTLDTEDEYLGKREHGKSKDEKELDKMNVRKSWYW